MKYEIKDYTNNVAELWASMQSKLDLLSLLNKALFCIFEDKSLPIDITHLNYYAYSSLNKKRYFSFQIPKKKKGEFRTIDAPCSRLKTIQQCLNILFQEIYTPHSAAMGFVPHRCVVDGALIHLHQKFVFNIDLKDFFPSITSGRVYNRLQSKPFSLNKELASVITNLCCYTNAEGKKVLPQGAPTSPTITNFICERLDRKLSKLAKAYNLKYSRYADDITFSGMTNVFKEDGKFCTSLKNIIENEEHFTINQEKTRLLHRGNRQEVTGITVNEKPNVSRKYVKQLRTMIHNWEVLGYDNAQKIFTKKSNHASIQNIDHTKDSQNEQTLSYLITDAHTKPLESKLINISRFGGNMSCVDYAIENITDIERLPGDTNEYYAKLQLLKWFSGVQLKGFKVVDEAGNQVFIEYAHNLTVELKGKGVHTVADWLKIIHGSNYVDDVVSRELGDKVFPIKRLVGKFQKNFHKMTDDKILELSKIIADIKANKDVYKNSEKLTDLFEYLKRDINECINLSPAHSTTQLSHRIDKDGKVVLTLNSVIDEEVIGSFDICNIDDLINLSSETKDFSGFASNNAFDFLYQCFFDESGNLRESPNKNENYLVPFAKFQVSQQYIDELREFGEEIDYIANYASIFTVAVSKENHIDGEKRHALKNNLYPIHRIENVISGKLDYLKMVKGENDETYKKLRKRFDDLIEKVHPNVIYSQKEDTKCESNPTENNIVKKNEIVEEFIALEKLLE